MRLEQQWDKLMSQTSSLSRLQELLPQLFQATELPGEPYLRCQLTPELSVVMSMEYVQESLLVPREQITPIPNMLASVIGLMNSRDRVFCVIDLAQLLGLSSPTLCRQYHTVVISVSQFVGDNFTCEEELLIGLVFSQIQGLTRVLPETIHLPGDAGQLPQEDLFYPLIPYVKAWVIEPEKKLPILDLANIVHQII